MASFDKNDTQNKVYEVIAEKLSIDKNTITPQMTFQDLGADSLDMVEIIMRLEELFNIEINDEDAEKLTTVGQSVDYVHGLRK